MVNKLELAISLGFTSTPQNSLPTCLSLFRSPIIHTKRKVLIPKWRTYGVENITRLYHRGPIGEDWDMNFETQRSRGGTAIIVLKRCFPALILVWACVFPPPLFAAETGKSGVVEKTREKPVGTVAKKAAADVEHAELKTTRPEALKGPTNVHFMVFVLNISKIDDAGQNFTANVFLRLRWKDSRLATSEGAVRKLPLEAVWNPRILLANQQGRVARALPEIVQVHPDGTVLYFQRYTGKFSQRLMLADFPRDTHSFIIQFVAAGYPADELTFAPDLVRKIRGGSMAKEVSLPDWKILQYETRTDPYNPIEEINAAAFEFQFVAQRHLAYYLWQVLLPLMVIVIMSWTAFWIGREHINVRIAVATSSILTLVAQRFVLATLLPKLPYMTRLDYFTVGSTLLVLLALILVIVTGFLVVHNKERQAQNIDHWTRGAFPAAFLLLIIWFLVG